MSRAPASRLHGGAMLAVVWLAASGCGVREGAPLSRSYAVVKSYESAQTTVRLKVERTTMTVAESILVVLEAEARDGANVRFPESVAAGPEASFTVADSGDEAARSSSRGAVRSSRWFRLEPFLSGEYAVEPFAVEVTDAKGARRTVRTDRIAVKVTSLLPKDYNRLEIKDIEGILRPPWRMATRAWIVLGILGAAGVGTGAWLWWQRRALARLAPQPRPAHEIAYEEIDALLAEDLVAHGEVKLFYQRVTGVLRRYIERRFGLRAPERTTEEFLYELRETGVLSEELKKLLRAFLQHCDLVKFAQLRPLEGEILGTLESCRDFIRATELAASPMGPGVTGGSTGAV